MRNLKKNRLYKYIYFMKGCLPKTLFFYFAFLSLSVPDEGYSRNVSCVVITAEKLSKILGGILVTVL